ncbi:Nudix hydrolase 21, chloroplastic, partial [Dionaea muscipula]
SNSGTKAKEDLVAATHAVECIPYRYKGSCKNGTEVEVLVISSQKVRGKGMMSPKGGWELDESVEEVAHRESLEEAGVLGSLEGELGTWSYKSKSHDTIYEGCMFSLLVEEQLDRRRMYNKGYG